MITMNALSESVRNAVELAGRAPSVHNTQPWRFALSGDAIDLYADEQCWLRVADPDQRDLVVSCGAALHHLRVALAAAGIGAQVRRLPDPARPDLLASVVLEGGVDRVDATLVEQIPRRRSDRRAFRNWPLPDAFRQQLFDRAAEQGVLLLHVDDAERRALLAGAFATAAAVQTSRPEYVEELAAWTDHIDSHGIPAENLVRPAPPSVVAARDFGVPRETVNNIEPEQAMLVVLGTASDDRLSRLRAGEAASAVLLEATRQGLASCPLSQVLEVEQSRAVVAADVLGGSLCPQLLLRIGWAPETPLPATPRRPVSETIVGRS
ncbi:NAD(P)H nitroreductase [Microlunatus ginsengisoli]|uniref:NAD(P)H nitroreductase n=2 Tax=Microlunatus ginsengisoli TaxID=363863 RepID=A0ABP7A4W1_9ACTN